MLYPKAIGRLFSFIHSASRGHKIFSFKKTLILAISVIFVAIHFHDARAEELKLIPDARSEDLIPDYRAVPLAPDVRVEELRLIPELTPDVGAEEFRFVPLVFSLFAKEEYSDNITFAADQDNKIDDFITTISPRLWFQENTERFVANLVGQVDFLGYGQNSNFNTNDQYYLGDIGYRLTSRLDVSAAGGYAKDSRRDRDIETTGLVILSNAQRTREVFRLGAEYALSEISSTGLSYAYDHDDYDDKEFVDFESHKTDFSFTRDLSDFVARTSGRMGLGHTQFDFDDLEVGTYSVALGATYQLSELFSVVADIGATHYSSTFEPIDVDHEDWLPIGNAFITYRGERTNVNFGFSKAVEAVSGRDGVSDRTALNFNISRRVTEGLRLGLGAGYFGNKAEEGELALEQIDERTFRIQPRIRYDISRNISLETVYKYNWIDDKVDNLERTRNLVYIRLSMQYPFFE